MEIQDLWRRCEVPSVGKEPYRGSFLTYRSRGEALAAGDRRRCLSGSWRFSYQEDVNTPAGEFPAPGYDDSGWDTIPVPGCWQLFGYGIPIYTNTVYPFQEDSPRLHPPHIPDEKNSKGWYRTTFSLTDREREGQVLLHFLGVESAFYVWINGQLAGFSQNSFSPAEFNITPYLVDGENTLAVEVYRYCACSYIEDQDMWRTSGIIRDVYLIFEPDVRILDFHAKPVLDADYRDAALDILVKVRNDAAHPAEPCSVEAELFDADGLPVGDGALASGLTGMENPDWPVNSWRKEDDFGRNAKVENKPKPLHAGVTRTVYLRGRVRRPAQWSAESPYLYTLLLTLRDHRGAVVHVARGRIGFREIKMEKGAFYLNGRPIKFKGMNLHEFHPRKGRAVDRELMVRDIVMMKRANFNALRCSHYPHHPELYELCDEYGLYVMDECNLESHELSYKDDILPGNDLRWTNACIDRVASSVQVNKNSPSVVVWSMSNEAGYGENIALMAAYARTLDGTRLIHERQMYVIADMESDTYPGLEWVERRAKLRPEFPYILNEYAHAMGNAMGNLADYWALFERYPNLGGGFVWEWCDHNLPLVCADGIAISAYGGDFGDRPNSGNFIIDGVVTGERMETPKLAELTRVQQYMRAELVDGAAGIIDVYNLHYHVNSADLSAEWRVERNGQTVLGGKLDDLNIEPGMSRRYRLPFPAGLYAEPGEYFLNLSFCLREAASWAQQGFCTARCQLFLQKTERPAAASPAGGVTVRETPDAFVFASAAMECAFSKISGEMISFMVNGKAFLREGIAAQHGPRFSAFRAPTDNDRHSSTMLGEHGWQKLGLDALQTETSEIRLLPSDGAAGLAVHLIHRCCGGAGFHQYTVYTVASGLIRVESILQPFGKIGVLPRLGFVMALDGALDRLDWYGRGPHESYADRKASADIGAWRRAVADEPMVYIRPQEMGNHEDTRWCAVTDEGGAGLLVAGDKPFCFTASRYTAQMLSGCSHRERLAPSDETILSIDDAQNGLGNASCGSETRPEYRLYPETVSFAYTMLAMDQAADPFALAAIRPDSPSPESVFEIDRSLSIDCSAWDRGNFQPFDPSDREARRRAGFTV